MKPPQSCHNNLTIVKLKRLFENLRMLTDFGTVYASRKSYANSMEVKIDLPELPFERSLSYPNLEDRIKARTVSRRWCNTIHSIKVNHRSIRSAGANSSPERADWRSAVHLLRISSAPPDSSLYLTHSASRFSPTFSTLYQLYQLNTENALMFASALNFVDWKNSLFSDSIVQLPLIWRSILG